MASSPPPASVHIGENSPEQVAFNLMCRIASVEGKNLSSHSSSGFQESGAGTGRKWILDTYAECLLAVQDPHARLRGAQDDIRGQSKRPRVDFDE